MATITKTFRNNLCADLAAEHLNYLARMSGNANNWSEIILAFDRFYLSMLNQYPTQTSVLDVLAQAANMKDHLKPVFELYAKELNNPASFVWQKKTGLQPKSYK